jgi:hypothetical protein
VSIGVLAYAVGQFRSGRSKAKSDAITIAQQEVTVYQARLGRVESELSSALKSIDELKASVQYLKEQNELLKTVEVDTKQVAEALRVVTAAIADELANEQRRQTDEILAAVKEQHIEILDTIKRRSP